MAPQVYTTMYKEQFTSPGRGKREQLRPTSVHRRNNPQPRPDFLFPWSLQPNSRSRCTLPHPSPPVNTGRPLFPPVRHLSFHSPVTTCPDNTGKPNHKPPVNPSTVQDLPSADRLQKLQLTEPLPGTAFKLHAARQHVGAQLRTRRQTNNPHHLFPRTQHRSSSSGSSQDYSGCYSCFHVVKPYKAGHYTIHPEFVSEYLR